MKYMKKLLTVLVAAVMVMAMAIPAMAAQSEVGSIKITNATKGQTYTAYKIFDATAGSNNAVSYTTNAAGKEIIANDTSAPFTVAETADANGNYSVAKKSNATDASVIDWVKAKYLSFSSAGKTGAFDSTGSTYTISGLELGYYYVTSSLGSVISIDTVTGTNKEIKDKNQQGPNTPKKEIVAEDEAAIGATNENDAKVGSKETFQVSYNATNWVTTGEGTDVSTQQVTNFYIKDTPTGLAIDNNSVAITVNGSTLNSSAFTSSVDDETGVLTISIPWVDSDNNSLYEPLKTSNANIPVVVTYNAVITAAAATATAPNEVSIEYNHDGTTGQNVTDPKDPPKTTTYTYKFQLKKTDNQNKELTGAQFELYDGNTKLAFVNTEDGYRVAASDDLNAITTIDMTSVSKVTITGLDKKDYTLKETKAPDGYTLAANTTVSANTLVRVDSDIEGTNGVVTVINNPGSLLPSTGGIGTTIFYVIGAILVIAAGVALIARRRMNVR